MRAAIFNPYWDSLGGGERYAISVAEILSRNGWDIDVEWHDPLIKGKLENRFGLNLEKINIVPDTKRGDGYDIMFWVSDGSIPTLKARKNFLHFQFPFKGVNGVTLINKMKLFRINKVICNSNFTKEFVDKEYGVNSLVIYPPVSTESFKPIKKENTILYVGRFSELTQAKRHDVLVSSFKKLYDSGYNEWKLILAGGVEVGAGEEFKMLKESIKTYPIKIVESPTFKDLKKIVGEAKIFWSAAGFGVDERKDPKKVEHFGMTVVESMSAGVLPIIYCAGGYPEIIKEGENGFLWKDTAELIRKTKKVISDGKTLKKISLNARRDSDKFSYSNFEKKFLDLL